LSAAEERVVVRRSTKISTLLRHGAAEEGLAMDAAGWVDKSEVTRILGYDGAEIDEALLHNDKGRLEAFGDRIRAVQGHSLGGAPVTLEALEASWERVAPEGVFYHATRAQNVGSISESGIHAQGRTHVHLAEMRESVGTTSGRGEALVVVDAQRLGELGVGTFRAPNGVVLVREVPPEAIVETLVNSND
jgi:putative RNA 2'-phosphotransferase